jgi:bis(5'-nucleosyl)-tetraphosphatase (symmetrical)
MATYIVGDVHGCFDELQQLLKLVDFNTQQDELWLTGDLVTRGPKSLETIRFMKELGDAGKIVLGNHDLHLLAIHEGIHPNNKKDNLTPIFAAPDCDELLKWLRFQPLILRHPEFNFVMVHAGISPQWTIKQAEKLAKEIEFKLQADNYKQLLEDMYGCLPRSWSEDLKGINRMRFIFNVFTQMRYCFTDGSLEFKNKLSPEQTHNTNLKPWFEIETLDQSSAIIFGHWAALLGKVNKADIYALDTGCIWGNSLTMLRWQDKKRFSVSCF